MEQNPSNEINVTHLNQMVLKEQTEPLNSIELAEDLYEVAVSGFGGQSPWTVNSLEQSITSANTILVIAKIDNKIAGFLMASETKNELDIYLIVVASPYKRKHTGTKLLDYLAEYGAGKGIDFIILETRESNTPARNLYQSVGFQEVGLRRGYYSSPIEHAIVMQRNVREELND